jgi:hypothetical protein
MKFLDFFYFVGHFFYLLDKGPDPDSKNGSGTQKLVGTGNIYSRVVELNWFQCRSGSSILGHCGSEYSSVSESKDLMTKIAEFYP